MKILVQGKPMIHSQPRGLKTFKCGHCGCEFEADCTEYEYKILVTGQEGYVSDCPGCLRHVLYSPIQSWEIKPSGCGLQDLMMIHDDDHK